MIFRSFRYSLINLFNLSLACQPSCLNETPTGPPSVEAPPPLAEAPRYKHQGTNKPQIQMIQTKFLPFSFYLGKNSELIVMFLRIRSSRQFFFRKIVEV